MVISPSHFISSKFFYVVTFFPYTMANISSIDKRGKRHDTGKNCAICNGRATIFHQRNFYMVCVFQHVTFLYMDYFIFFGFVSEFQLHTFRYHDQFDYGLFVLCLLMQYIRYNSCCF